MLLNFPSRIPIAFDAPQGLISNSTKGGGNIIDQTIFHYKIIDKFGGGEMGLPLRIQRLNKSQE